MAGRQARDFLIERARFVHRLLGAHRDNCVELWIDVLDAAQGGVHQLTGLEFAPLDQCGEFVSGFPIQIGHDGLRAIRWRFRCDFYYGLGGEWKPPDPARCIGGSI
jgi:hypothetical protein